MGTKEPLTEPEVPQFSDYAPTRSQDSAPGSETPNPHDGPYRGTRRQTARSSPNRETGGRSQGSQATVMEDTMHPARAAALNEDSFSKLLKEAREAYSTDLQDFRVDHSLYESQNKKIKTIHQWMKDSVNSSYFQTCLAVTHDWVKGYNNLKAQVGQGTRETQKSIRSEYNKLMGSFKPGHKDLNGWITKWEETMIKGQKKSMAFALDTEEWSSRFLEVIRPLDEAWATAFELTVETKLDEGTLTFKELANAFRRLISRIKRERSNSRVSKGSFYTRERETERERKDQPREHSQGRDRSRGRSSTPIKKHFTLSSYFSNVPNLNARINEYNQWFGRIAIFILLAINLCQSHQLISSGEGFATYYYDIKQPDACHISLSNMNSIPMQCGPSADDVNSNYIVAINLTQLNLDMTFYCGKQVIIPINDKISTLLLFVGDGCKRSGGGSPSSDTWNSEAASRLDLSYSVLDELADGAACGKGYIRITWEIRDVLLYDFNSNVSRSQQGLVTSETSALVTPNSAASTVCFEGSWQCSRNSEVLEQCFDQIWIPHATCPADHGIKERCHFPFNFADKCEYEEELSSSSSDGVSTSESVPTPTTGTVITASTTFATSILNSVSKGITRTTPGLSGWATSALSVTRQSLNSTKIVIITETTTVCVSSSSL
ncbi:hypothetical protein TSTA_062060 [Talaromyces stipitatus ATCC 10500]|uniref:Uncharacterized protein n=1 Tax=Talaromyces stipitatus (strain ATCC 10500 / CBS 375.48 / QM 6759 / NRRL 1006) TaxID=441959 RepID=B8LX68_TALSN|nr:uncharacterized protein TSTA_062060 [Talaromyces stipitatus ATCC 10500]EED22718.1 hypothetical protein TSTA_062060 [Talaromyces stipitatus ATCC 10500]